MRENEGVLLNQPVKAGCVKQVVFLQPPAFQAGSRGSSLSLALTSSIDPLKSPFQADSQGYAMSKCTNNAGNEGTCS